MLYVNGPFHREGPLYILGNFRCSNSPIMITRRVLTDNHQMLLVFVKPPVNMVKPSIGCHPPCCPNKRAEIWSMAYKYKRRCIVNNCGSTGRDVPLQNKYTLEQGAEESEMDIIFTGCRNPCAGQSDICGVSPSFCGKNPQLIISVSHVIMVLSNTAVRQVG